MEKCETYDINFNGQLIDLPGQVIDFFSTQQSVRDIGLRKFPLTADAICVWLLANWHQDDCLW